MSRILPLILVLLSSCSPIGQSVTSEKQVKIIEALISIPEGGGPLSSYDRYYSDKGNSIDFVFLAVDGEGRTYVVSPREMPSVHDGGCSVISGTYIKADKKIANVGCNGEA